MGRPTKVGLDYFSFDVDFFEDEKVIPVSSEFGAKGECVLVRVLCAIYRNGYFAECSDAFMFKIAKQTNLQFSLVNEVISGLVRWGFLDKTMFNSFGVLTSKGIQRRWKEATRKRVSKAKYPYWILDDETEKKEFPAEESLFLAEETRFIPPESTQSKVNKKKEKEIKKENDSVVNNSFQKYFYSVDEIKSFMLAEENVVWKEAFCMNNHISVKDIEASISDFVLRLQNENSEPKHRNDIFRHFSNWFIKRNYEQSRTTTKETNVFKA